MSQSGRCFSLQKINRLLQRRGVGEMSGPRRRHGDQSHHTAFLEKHLCLALYSGKCNDPVDEVHYACVCE